MKSISTLIASLFIIMTPLCAQKKGQNNYSAREWRNIANRSTEEFFSTPKAKEYAENVLLYQRNVGGWPKNMPMHKPLSEEEKQELINLKDNPNDCTTDNNATISEMKYLNGMYKATSDIRYKEAFNKGLAFILSGQYENGGWPQFWPDPKGYQIHITFNDDSMMNIMDLIKEYVNKDGKYASVRDNKLIKRCETAHKKGIEAILKCQYVKDGKKTIWPQQSDRENYEPRKARSYELPSLTPQESVAVIRHLMNIENPSPEVRDAVISAMNWLEENKITGIKVEGFRDEYEEFDRHIVYDENALPLWARYYDLETGKPFFCGRDGVKKETMAEIERERRAGYGWYSDNPRILFDLYAEWSEKNKK